jgi:bifunctional non-homologous end joining protein LigD
MATAKRAKPRAGTKAKPKAAATKTSKPKSKRAPRSATETAPAKAPTNPSGKAAAKLGEYRSKRDFTKTAEPAGGSVARTGTLRFVVQKHAARQVHFDLRLEMDGVMKSWAVPKGPSLDPSVKRLAMQVEDHPIEYNTFEGTIPHGEYGGGTVMLWDRGTYIADPAMAKGESDEVAVQHGYDRGDLKVVMNGERMRGSWVLVRTRFGPGRSSSSSAKPSWLLIKHRDAFAAPGSDIVADAVTSVESGRTMEEISAQPSPAAAP